MDAKKNRAAIRSLVKERLDGDWRSAEEMLTSVERAAVAEAVAEPIRLLVEATTSDDAMGAAIMALALLRKAARR